MNVVKAFILCISICLSTNLLHAQKKTPVKAEKKIAKFKPPRLYTYLEEYIDSVAINSGTGEAIVARQLRIVDDKKNIYKISSYQFLYKKMVVTEDEESGKVSPTSTIFAGRFNTTPLPEAWVNKVREQLRPGDKLHYFDLIVKDAQGRVMYAPDIKFTIK